MPRQGGDRDVVSAGHVPAMVLDRHIGLISTGSFGEEGVHVPTESEREYLSALASHVAVSLDRIHLLDERRIAEEALRDSEERYRQLVELSPDAIFVHSADELLFVNPAAVRLLGATGQEELVGQPTMLFVHPEYRSGALEVLRRAWQEREVVPMIEQKLIRLDGSFIDVEATITPFMFKGQLQLLSIAHDITPRNRAEAALRISESKFRGLLQNMFDGVYQTTADGRVLTANAALVRMLGYDSVDELLAMNARDWYMQPEERDRLSTLLMTAGEAHNIETTLRRKDGQHIVFLENARCVSGADGELLYFEGTLTDITERKRAETERTKLADQLRQAQRMESIGLLAAGIAHDFNNLLTPITGFAELLLLDMAPDDPRADSLRQIECAADSARTLTRQLLAFGRKQVVELKRVTVGDMVRRFMPILRRTIREDIRMELSITPEAGAVMADVGQMEQVLTNLAVNAQDAMPEGGVLTIETGNIDLDESHASRHLEVKPGPYVMLSVSDTGIGMDRETQEHLFEPFFTMKAGGKGTGLGLSTVYGIVKQHDGSVFVYSEIGKGSTIRIYLPRVTGSPTTDEPAPEVPASHPGSIGMETILLVEDDELVRILAFEMLSRLGYRVIVADSPQSCIAVVQHSLGEIDLLLTDVVLPGMDGPELCQRLRAEKPDLRVLYMSGYTNHVIARHGIAEGGAGFIEKPLSLRSLAQKVRNALDS